MMIGRVCRFYGWTVDHVLKMPAPRFFLMYETVDKLEGKELANLCYVSRSAQLTNEAFATTHEFFNTIGEEKVRPKDIDLSQYTKPLSGEEARRAVMAAFAKDTRINHRVAEKIKNPHPRRR